MAKSRCSACCRFSSYHSPGSCATLAELVVHEVFKESRARRAHGRESPAALDRRSQGHPGLERMIPECHLVSQDRRERVLARLLLALAERHDLGAIGEPQEANRVLDLADRKR